MVAVVKFTTEAVNFINEKGSVYDIPTMAFKSLFNGEITQDLLESKLNYQIEGKVSGTLVEPVSAILCRRVLVIYI